jgi:hypothetical protein
MIRVNNKIKQLLIVGIVLLFFSSAFGLLQNYTPPISATHTSQITTPSLSQGDTASISTIQNDFVNKAVANSGTTTKTLTAIEATSQQSKKVDSGSSFALNSAGTCAHTSVSMGSIQYWKGSKIPQLILAFTPGAELSGSNICYNICSGIDTINIGNYTYSCLFTHAHSSSSAFYIYLETSISSGFTPSLSTGYYPVSISLKVCSLNGDTFDESPPNSIKTSNSVSGSSTCTFSTTQPVADSQPIATGWTYSGQSTPSSTITIPQYESSYNITWTTTQVGEAVYNSNSYTSSSFAGSLVANTITFNSDGNDPNVPSYTFSYNLTDQHQVKASCFNDGTQSISYTIVNKSSNEFTTSLSDCLGTPPSAYFGTYESSQSSLTTTQATDKYTGSISDLVQLYPTADQNYWEYRISGSSSIANTSQSSTTDHTVPLPTYTTTSSGTPSWTIYTYEFANSKPVIHTAAIKFSNHNSTAILFLNATQPTFVNEHQALKITWGDGSSNIYTGIAPTLFQESHKYAHVGSYAITAVLINNPSPTNPNISSLSMQQTYTYTISIYPKPSPNQDAQLLANQGIYLNFSTLHDVVHNVVLQIDGNNVKSYTVNSISGHLSFHPSEAGRTGFKATWIFDGATFSYSVSYVAPFYPSYNSNYLIASYASNATHQYPISISNSPSGTGYYQQLITINNYTKYGINTAVSNFEIASNNGTLLYTWIQSYNSTTLTIWVKMPYGTTSVNLQVFPQFENLLSATGYVGEASQLNPSDDNGKLVFPYYQSFYNGVPNGYYSTTGGGGTITIANHQLKLLADNLSATSPVGAFIVSNTGFTQNSNLTIVSYLNFTGTNDITDARARIYLDSSSQGSGIDGHTGSIVNDATGGGDYGFYGTGSYERTFSNKSTANYNLFSWSPSNTYMDFQRLYSTGFAVSDYNVNSSVWYDQGILSNNSFNYSSSNIWYPEIQASVDTGSDGPVSITTPYLFAINNLPNNIMPTTTIGTGTDFISNSTTLNRVFYSSTANYASNPLMQIYTYNIYDSFNSNYITVYANPNWTYESSSGYSQYFPSAHALTFENISGVGQVQVTFLQPSQQIGQASFISLTATQNKQPVQLLSGFTINTKYTTFNSHKVHYKNGTGNSLQLPFGSTASFRIYDGWDQQVGIATSVLIDQSTVALNVPVALTYVSFQFINTTSSQVAIQANNITQKESGFSSFYVATSNTYSYSASIYDSSLGKNVLFKGIFTAQASTKTVYINASAPLAELQLNANAYSGSQLGELSSSGSDKIYMSVNGILTDLGSTFVGTMGETLHIRIYTVLNQTLYSGSYLLNSPYASTTINILTPSWNFQIKNAEQIYNTTSPLANEIINLTFLNGTHNNSFYTSDMVGNTLSLYLATGNYHIHLHDNATFSANFTLSNNTYYIVFGQHLLTVSEYNKVIGSIYANTAGLSVLPVNAPSQLYKGETTKLEWAIYYANGTALSTSALDAYLANSSISIINSTQSLALTPEVSGGVIYASFTPPSAGSYTIKIIGGFSSNGNVVAGKYSYPIVVLTTSKDLGLHLDISGPTTISANTTNTYYLEFTYTNGSSLSSASSGSLTNNLTATFQSTNLAVSTISNGMYTVDLSASATENALLLVSGYFKQSGYNLSTSNFYSVNIISTSQQLLVIPKDVPTTVTVGSNTSDKFQLLYPNGTALTNAALASIVASSTITLENTKVVQASVQDAGNYIYINYTIPTNGYYTLTWTSIIGNSPRFTLLYSQSVEGATAPVVDRGMHITISGPSTVYSGESYYYYFVLSYTNGTYFNSANTQEAYENMSIQLFNGGTLLTSYTPNIQSNGVVFAQISVSGVYSGLSLQVSSHLMSAINLSAKSLLSISSVSPNSTSKISLIGVDTPNNVLTGQRVTFIYKAQFSNGTYLSDSAWSTLLSGSSISILNTNSLSYTTYLDNGELYLNTTPTTNGYYTISISGSATYGKITDSVVYSFTFASSTTTPIDSGMHIQIIGASSIQADTSTIYYLEFTYNNGTLFSPTDTKMALANLTFNILSGKTIEGTVSGTYSQSGIISVSVTVPSGSYILNATTHEFSGIILAGSALYPISAFTSTQILHVIPVDTPATVPLNTSIPYVFEIEYANGTLLNSSQLSSLASSMSVSVRNSETLTTTYAVSGNELYIYFEITSPGYYTFSLTGVLKSTTIYSYVFSQHVETQPIVNNGLIMHVSGPTTIIVNQTYVYYIMLSLENGNPLNLTTTESAALIMSIQEKQGSTLITNITAKVESKGVLYFSVQASKVYSDFSIYIKDHVKTNNAVDIQPVTIETNAGQLKIIPVDTPSSTQIKQLTFFKYRVAFPNGTLLSTSDINSMINGLNFTLENSADIVPTMQAYNDFLYVNFTLPNVGYYTLSFSGQWTCDGTSYSIVYSQSVEGATAPVVDRGMHITISGPSTVYSGESYYYYFVLSYTNGTYFNSANTQEAYENMSIQLFNGGTLLTSYTPNIQSNGVVFAQISVSGVYSGLSLQVSSHLMSAINLSAKSLLSISSVSPNSTSKISLIGVDTPNNVLTGQRVTFIYKAQFSNGTYLSDSAWSTLLSGSSISILNTNSLSYTTYLDNGELYLNTTPTTNGYYTISISGSATYGKITDSVVYSFTFASSTTTPIDSGMHIQIIGASSIQADTSTIYYLEFTYNNGTLFSPTDTKMALANLTFNILSGKTIEGTVSGTYSQSGIISVSVTVPSGSYILNATTHEFSGIILAGSALYPISAFTSTQILHVIPVDTPATVPLNTSIPYVFEIEYANGTLLNSSQLSSLASSMSVSVRNSETLTTTYAVSGNELYIYFEITSPGYYTFSLTGVLKSTTIYSYVFSQHVETQPIVNNGLIMHVSGPTTIIVNQTYVYYIMLSLENGNPLNLTTTESAALIMSIQEKQGSTLITNITAKVESKGVLYFSVQASKVYSDFSIYIKDHVKTNNAVDIQPVTIETNAGQLKIIPVDTPSSTQIKQLTFFKYRVAFPNGTLLSTSDINSMINGLNFTLENSADIVPTMQAYNDFLYVNFTLPNVGYYTLSFSGQWTCDGTSYSIVYSQSVEAVNAALSAVGITWQTSPTPGSSILVNTTQPIYLYLYYSSGQNHTSLSASDTIAVQRNLTLEIYDGSTFRGVVTTSIISSGVLRFQINLTSVGQNWFVRLIISKTVISTGATVSANQPIPFVGSNVSPSNPLGFLSGISNAVSAIALGIYNLGEWILLAGGIIAGLFELYKIARRRHERNISNGGSDISGSKQYVLDKATFAGIQSLTPKELSVYKGIDKEELKTYNNGMNELIKSGNNRQSFDAKHPELRKL